MAVMIPSQIVQRGWCQHTHARNDAMQRCESITDHDATKWDLAGALFLSQISGSNNPGAIARTLEATGEETLQRYNDRPGRTQAEVVELLRGLGL